MKQIEMRERERERENAVTVRERKWINEEEGEE
jgi:hypothetical protein